MGAAGALLLAIAVLSTLTAVNSVAPQLRHGVAITNDGWLKGRLLAGGRSLFFVTGGGGRGDSSGLAKTAANHLLSYLRQTISICWMFLAMEPESWSAGWMRKDVNGRFG